MKTHLLLLVLIAGLTGCSTPMLRPITNTLAATGGAALGSTLLRNRAAGAAAGAAGGVVLTESFFHLKSRAEQKAFKSGYEEALSDQIKTEFWRQTLRHQPSDGSFLQVPIPLPERVTPDGVRLVPATEFIPIHP